MSGPDIPYGRQSISAEDEAAVLAVLRSERLTQGPEVPGFEAELAASCEASHAVCCNSATSALHASALALGLRPGKRLWTSPITFVASANCGALCGAEVDFVDVEAATGNIDPQALAERLVKAEASGELPDVLVPVDLAGQPCDMPALRHLARRYGFRILRDASHALGAEEAGRPVGADGSADITVFSLHPVKMITAGEGGVALTADAELASSLRRIRCHGLDPETHDPDQPWRLVQPGLGLNYRMPDLSAALGRSQLKRLGSFVERRRWWAERYDEALVGTSVKALRRASARRSSWHLYVVRAQNKEARKTLWSQMQAAKIRVQVHYPPVCDQPYYQAQGTALGIDALPGARAYSETALSLPLFVDMREEDFAATLRVLTAFPSDESQVAMESEAR